MCFSPFLRDWVRVCGIFVGTEDVLLRLLRAAVEQGYMAAYFVCHRIVSVDTCFSVDVCRKFYIVVMMDQVIKEW